MYSRAVLFDPYLSNKVGARDSLSDMLKMRLSANGYVTSQIMSVVIRSITAMRDLSCIAVEHIAKVIILRKVNQ